MATVSQLSETHSPFDPIVIHCEQSQPHSSSFQITDDAKVIRGCSFILHGIPPGLKLQRRRSLFQVIGEALHKGTWEGQLCIDIEKGQILRTQLIFVVR